MAEEYLDDNAGGSGRAALAGYDYQMHVSVWLALLLVVANRQARELILEPPLKKTLKERWRSSSPGGSRVKCSWELINSSFRLNFVAVTHGA